MIWMASSRDEIGIWLYTSGDNAEAYFRLLEEKREEIHTEMEKRFNGLNSQETGRNRICLNKGDTDPLDENDWPYQYEWFTTQLEAFNTVFRERIRALDADDWIPEKDDP